MPNIPIATILGGIGAAGAVGSVGYIAYNSVFSVQPGQRALVFNRVAGLKKDTLNEGTHIVTPWFEWPIIMDVRTRANQQKSQSGTRDLQMVDIGYRMLVRPQAGHLLELYRTVGVDWENKILPSIGNEVVKQVIAQYNATALLTQREQVSKKIQQDLRERARDFFIDVEDVSITDLRFSPVFEKAVEAKQVAQQEAERARFIVDKAMQDKKTTILRAEAEAQTVEMIGRAAMNDPGFVALRRIDAAKDIAHMIANSSNQVYLPSDGLLLNLMSSVAASPVGPAAAAGKKY